MSGNNSLQCHDIDTALRSIGYSNMHSYNSMDIVKPLEIFGLGEPLHTSSKERDIFASPCAYDRYQSVIGQLPCQACVGEIVDTFFCDVNWQHTLLDRNYFDYQLKQLHSTARGCRDEDAIIFAAVLFQVLALGLQFMPGTHSCYANGACQNSETKYSDTSAELLLLFKRDAMNLTFVLAGLLRVLWLKNRGLVLEAWKALGQVTRDALDIGLHRDNVKIEVADGETACEQLWSLHMERRTMVNVFLWDR